MIYCLQLLLLRSSNGIADADETVDGTVATHDQLGKKKLSALAAGVA